MRILIVHNAYQQRGGEDAVVDAEAGLLAAAGHDVKKLIVSNDEVTSFARRVGVTLSAPFNAERKRWMADEVRRFRPDIVHIHNFFPLLSPSVHEGAAEAGAAVVQTLHNYRLICAAATFLRNNEVCTKCLDGSPLWGVVHRCYRDSVVGSAAIVAMQSSYRRHAVASGSVHRFIVLADFARTLFASSGLPEDRIVVRPNFVPDRLRPARPRAGALYVGRLSAEKGVSTLVEAWRSIPDHQLTIVGDGPLRRQLESSAPPNVRFLGQANADEVADRMAAAQLLVVPSIWPETFGLIVIEAFCQGLPVLASDIGALKDIVVPGMTGDHFAPGNVAQLSERVSAMLGAPDALAEMGKQARATYNALYTPQQGLHTLEATYRSALAAARPA